MTKEQLMKNFKKIGSEVTFFWDDTTETYVKNTPGAGGSLKAKLPGGKEFDLDPKSDIAVRVIAGGSFITEAEYKKG